MNHIETTRVYYVWWANINKDCPIENSHDSLLSNKTSSTNIDLHLISFSWDTTIGPVGLLEFLKNFDTSHSFYRKILPLTKIMYFLVIGFRIPGYLELPTKLHARFNTYLVWEIICY